MRRTAALLGLAFVAGVAAGVLLMRERPDPRIVAPDAVFRCAMHPWVGGAAAGRCTVCGMTLARASVAGPAELCGSPALITLAPASAAVIGVETVAVERRPLVRVLRVAGRLEADVTRRRVFTAPADGRVEKIYVASAGVDVRAGDPLFALFSRDLLVLQQETLQVARLGEGSGAALAETRQRLFQAGFAQRQIDDLLAQREPTTTPMILAPCDGTVIAHELEAGRWVRTGERLLELADLSRLWFVFDVAAPERAAVQVGANVEISFSGGGTISASVAFVERNTSETTGAIRVRAAFDNPGHWPHGAFAEGRLRLEHGPALVLPRSAVLDPGSGPVAWVERGGLTYEPRALQLGRRGDAEIEVLAGVGEGERVVTQGALLIDAQAQLARLPAARADQ